MKRIPLIAALAALCALTGCSTLMQSQYEGDAAYLRENHPSLTEEQIAQIIGSVNGRTAQPGGVAAPSATSNGTPVIRESACIGAVVYGVCHGVPTPEAQIKMHTGQMPRCYGAMIGGTCTGPMF